MKKIKPYLPIVIALIIIFVIIIGVLYFMGLISFGKKYTVKTDEGDTIVMTAKPGHIIRSIYPFAVPVSFEVKGKKESFSSEKSDEWMLPSDVNIKNTEFVFLSEVDGVRYYKINLDCGEGSDVVMIPEFMCIDENRDLWKLFERYDIVSALPDIYGDDKYYMDIFYGFAKYYLLAGEHDWIVKYGDLMMSEGDSNVINIINSIANGSTEIKSQEFDSEEIYNKCLELSGSFGDGYAMAQ